MKGKELAAPTAGAVGRAGAAVSAGITARAVTSPTTWRRIKESFRRRDNDIVSISDAAPQGGEAAWHGSINKHDASSRRRHKRNMENGVMWTCYRGWRQTRALAEKGVFISMDVEGSVAQKIVKRRRFIVVCLTARAAASTWLLNACWRRRTSHRLGSGISCSSPFACLRTECRMMKKTLEQQLVWRRKRWPGVALWLASNLCYVLARW